MSGLNANPNPRGQGVRALMLRLRIDWAKWKRQSFEDRAINGLNDGYTEAELASLSALLLGNGERGGEQKLVGDEVCLARTRLDLLFLHSMMLRGETTRGAELPDLASHLLPNEGSECMAIVLRVDAGKRIPLADGGDSRRTHYHSALRSKDPLLCPVGALALWLVLRWDIIAAEKPPDFADRASWYRAKLLPPRFSQPANPLSDVTQRHWLKLALESVGVNTSKAVHTMRQSSARLADMWEVPADQVSRSSVLFSPLNFTLPPSLCLLLLSTVCLRRG